ncbi:hypothetical protein D4S03_10140 [bacterium]|nr:MAG: hypothetical protein D4S03_10140 [bacterium]
MKPPTLHIYGQSTWHDDVLIVGDADALQLLRLAIGDALAGLELMATGAISLHNPSKTQRDVFVNDGEGYSVRVLCLPEVPANLAVPYTEDYAKERWGGSVGPHELFKEKP